MMEVEAMELSVIICVYNTDDSFFEECLDSITKSTLKTGSYEILVIDDGSKKDYSHYRDRYPIRLIKTENRGIFRARLLGIKEALGDYIVFVDSDDTVSFNYHRPMLEECKRSSLDVCLNDWAFHTERTRYACFADTTISGDILLFDDDILLAFAKNEGREHSYFVLWNKIFRSKILKCAAEELSCIAEKGERYNYSEDTLLCFKAFKHSKKCSNLHTGYYFYRIHPSQTVNITDEQRLITHVKFMSKTLDIMLSDTGENKHRSEIQASIKKWQGLMSRTHYSYAKANKYCHLYNFIKESYHVNELKKSSYRDNSAYSKNKVLPMNFTKIDEALYSLYTSNSEGVCLLGDDGYSKKCIGYMREYGKTVTESDDGVKIPRPRVKLKDRIIMHKLVYSLGLIFFKKGSRIRAFLKRHI